MGPAAQLLAMSTDPSAQAVVVRALPIELSQFVKFSGAAESGGQAKQLISEGAVQLNGVVVTQKGRKLAAGDRVMLNGQTFIVQLA